MTAAPSSQPGSNLPRTYCALPTETQSKLEEVFTPEILHELDNHLHARILHDLDEIAQENGGASIQFAADFWYSTKEYREYQQKLSLLTQRITHRLQEKIHQLLAPKSPLKDLEQSCHAIYQCVMDLLVPIANNFPWESHFLPHILTNIKSEVYAVLTCTLEIESENLKYSHPEIALQISEALNGLNQTHEQQTHLPLPGFKQRKIINRHRRNLRETRARNFFDHLKRKQIPDEDSGQSNLDAINNLAAEEYPPHVEEKINGGSIILDAIETPYADTSKTTQLYQITLRYREETSDLFSSQNEDSSPPSPHSIEVDNRKTGFTCCFDLLRGEIYLKQNIPLRTIMSAEDYEALRSCILNLILESGEEEPNSGEIENIQHQINNDLFSHLPIEEAERKRIEKQIGDYPEHERRVLLSLIEKLKTDSRSFGSNICRMNEGRNNYRLKHGKWRIIFTIENGVIDIKRIASRSKHTYSHL